MISGRLLKMKILAFPSSSFTDSAKVGGGIFLVQANPETYSVNYNIQYESAWRQSSGSAAFDPAWQKNPPKELSFEFLFDGTNAIPGANPLIDINLPGGSTLEEMADSILNKGTVAAQIKHFEATVFNVQGKEHAPNYLIIQWGTLIFKCRLQNMTINYKLFSPEGLPLRATVNATFKEVVNQEESKRRMKKSSPDLTHVKTVREGDNLPLMAKQIYKDERYYLAVAQANNLIQFRNLSAGQRIFFPPIKKEK